MDSLDLTSEQAALIRDQLSPARLYVRSLRNRIHECAFPPDDKVRQFAEQADDALQRLWLELHYLSCDSGRRRRA